mmetsp:Transcript_104557/g.281061  ORF Transcript_104557/g.281061 Transcript_104557/m.281061 type:complete len:207 (-) Transcript_104557:201-821(-)
MPNHPHHHFHCPCVCALARSLLDLAEEAGGRGKLGGWFLDHLLGCFVPRGRRLGDYCGQLQLLDERGAVLRHHGLELLQRRGPHEDEGSGAHGCWTCPLRSRHALGLDQVYGVQEHGHVLRGPDHRRDRRGQPTPGLLRLLGRGQGLLLQQCHGRRLPLRAVRQRARARRPPPDARRGPCLFQVGRAAGRVGLPNQGHPPLVLQLG